MFENEQKRRKVRCALLSVSDKTGIASFAAGLAGEGARILSTGGTAALLREQGLEVTDVSDYTGFPEIMNGRVKTLHPRVHGGILGREDTDSDTMLEYGIEPIDLVCINLYPFAQVVEAGSDDRTCIENIDIGGPAMLRAAAKNHDRVAVVVDPQQYDQVLTEVKQGGTSLSTRCRLAERAYGETSRYDAAISAYLQVGEDTGGEGGLEMPQVVSTTPLRYGENPHQKGVLAIFAGSGESATVATAKQLQGKQLSYNNYCDADAAWRAVCSLPANAQAACVIVKHTNPCGAASGKDTSHAYQRAFASDPHSAFGGIIAFNREVSEDCAKTILDTQFVEVVLAPEFSSAAVQTFAAKQNVRLLACGNASPDMSGSLHGHFIDGAVVIQEPLAVQASSADWQHVAGPEPNSHLLDELAFAWVLAAWAKSNAIVVCKDRQLVGVGAGQMSRVFSVQIAGIKAREAGLDTAGGVLASDAFFPFADGIERCAELGVAAIVQPGGSVRDDEVIQVADSAGIVMMLTGSRVFRH